MANVNVDVDECEEELDDCEQICLNHIGHHVCECEPGCELQNDNTTCLGILYNNGDVYDSIFQQILMNVKKAYLDVIKYVQMSIVWMVNTIVPVMITTI